MGCGWITARPFVTQPLVSLNRLFNPSRNRHTPMLPALASRDGRCRGLQLSHLLITEGVTDRGPDDCRREDQETPASSSRIALRPQLRNLFLVTLNRLLVELDALLIKRDSFVIYLDGGGAVFGCLLVIFRDGFVELEILLERVGFILEGLDLLIAYIVFVLGVLELDEGRLEQPVGFIELLAAIIQALPALLNGPARLLGAAASCTCIARTSA